MRKLIDMVEQSLMYHPRFRHSVGVMKMALKLNEIHCLNVDENLEILKTNVPEMIDENLLSSPSIWHAFTGKFIARDNYHIINDDILNAIFYHTTGRPNMSNLEKLIFLSDYIELGRVGKNFEDIREIAYKDINQAIISMYENQFEYLNSKNVMIYPLSKLAYEYYKKGEC